MSRLLFTGLAPAVITPMFEDGSVDYQAFERLIEHLIQQGAKALVINGTTAEATTLTSEEKAKLVSIASRISNKRVPIIAGAGSNHTQASIEASKLSKEAGADALLLVTPYYNKTSQRGLIAHFEAIVNAVELPAILYTVPGRTGMNILPDTLVTLAKNPCIVGIKDATGNTAYTMEILEKTKDLDFAVYSGEDGLILPMMAAGVKGVISVVGNVFPSVTQDLCEAVLNQDLEKAKSLAFDLAPLIRLLFADVNPIPAKSAMAYLGYGQDMCRLPLVPTENDLREKIEKEITRLQEMGY